MCKGGSAVSSATTPLPNCTIDTQCNIIDEGFRFHVEERQASFEWRVVVDLCTSAGGEKATTLPEVEVSSAAIRLRRSSAANAAGESVAWFMLPLPRHALPIDEERARCSFSKRRAELVVTWPMASELKEMLSEDQFREDVGTVAAAAIQKNVEIVDANNKAEDEPAKAKVAQIELVPGARKEEAQDEVNQKVHETEEEQVEQTEVEEENIDAEEWRLRGNAAVKAGDFEEAIRCYSEGLSYGGGDEAIMRCNRAHCCLKLDRHQEAFDDAHCCVGLRPDFFKGYLRGATALRCLGKFEEALAFLKRCPPNDEAGELVAALKPEAEAAQRARLSQLPGAERAKEEGNVLFKRGAFEDALAKYSEALGLCEEPEGALALMCRGNRAACAHQLSDYSAVVRDTSFVLAKDPQNFKALSRRMMALEPLERYQAALEDARAVLRLDPRHEAANKMQHRLGKLVRDMQRAESVQ